MGTLRKYTLFLRCSLTDKIREYKLTAESEETIRELFAKAADTIERIEPGWGDFTAWLGIYSEGWGRDFQRTRTIGISKSGVLRNRMTGGSGMIFGESESLPATNKTALF